MKSIRDYISGEIITEGTGNKFDFNIRQHAKTYNMLLKWYDKAIMHMNTEEVIDLLRNAIEQWENGNFDEA